MLKRNLMLKFILVSTLLASFFARAEEPLQSPLFMTTSVKPIMMLNMSKDHQLFFKLYDDYADITGALGGAPDGIPDTTYNNHYAYYGYFDSNKCYDYENGIFQPKYFTNNHYCRGNWSGNFLNWATMTRLDAVRKILYGGFRSSDMPNSSYTILERAMLPNDAHSFAKYYNGSDIGQLTPLTNTNTSRTPLIDQGVTFCSTSEPWRRNSFSQHDHGRPVLRVVRGNYSLWAGNERWQCLYQETMPVIPNSAWLIGENLNPPNSGIPAHSKSPSVYRSAPEGDYFVRVRVCNDQANLIDATNDEQCRGYEVDGKTHFKPAGLLQEYGEDDLILFGMMTGSYLKNKSGGVLRKKVGSMTNEINEDGTFKAAPKDGGIIDTLNKFTMSGYYWGEGVFNYSDSCWWTMSSFLDGQCQSWGNPQAEIYLESLRYLAGKSNNPSFWADDKPMYGLTAVKNWEDPIESGEDSNYCAPLNILQFNTSSSSYDTDNLSSANIDFSLNIDLFTNRIGDAENITGKQYFVGETGRNTDDQLCTAKTVNKLSDVQGSCPDAPRLEGGYDMAGLAFAARKEGIGSDREKVRTFGVALAPAIPKVEVLVPGTTDNFVNIIPACVNQALKPFGACAIVDFKVVDQTRTATQASGMIYVNWEDTEQGGDYDMDMWGTLKYTINNRQITITTDVIANTSTDGKLGFGYVLSGTTQDGFHMHAGINGVTYTDPTGVKGCHPCMYSDPPRSHVYKLGQSDATYLKPALYYAAKWGGYENDELTDEEIAGRKTDNYFYAIDPRNLKKAITTAFDEVSRSKSSASAAASSSTRLNGDTYVYQARFETDTWSGQILAYPMETDGTINMAKNPIWDSNKTLTTANGRKIYTYDGNEISNNKVVRKLIQLTDQNWNNGKFIDFKNALGFKTNATLAKQRFKWLLGEKVETLRTRKHLLGDIINSSPAYAGTGNQHFNTLPSTYGADTYLTYARLKSTFHSLLFVNANDGMVHAFDANTGKEVFAYIPRATYKKLADLSNIDFKHQYIVDGDLHVSDAYLKVNSSEREWRTIVTGSLGFGGHGIFALDITDTMKDPAKPPRVIFDFSTEDADSPIKNDLGYVLNKPLIVPTIDGTWRAIVGNGVNSAEGKSKLIAVNLDDPIDDTIVINTKDGFYANNENGLSGVALLPNKTGITTYAYGGDIRGNMWKFDLSNTDADKWKVAYGDEDKPEPLIRVVDDENNAQPISIVPTLGYNPLRQSDDDTGKYAIMVYFGTGKYYTGSDFGSEDVQSIYAIADVGIAHKLEYKQRAQFLHQKTIAKETGGRRTLKDDKTVNWSDKYGWFVDLETPDGDSNGERVLSKTLLLYNRLVVASYRPSQYQCDMGGDGWLMEFSAINGLYDDMSVLKEGTANTLLESAILSDLSPVVGKQALFLIANTVGDGTGPKLETFEGNLNGARDRISWKQMR